MKSGDFTITRDDLHFSKAFSEIKSRAFIQRIFSACAALTAKEPAARHRVWKKYNGESYDPSQFELVEGMWDHEHSSVCWFTISVGFAYWESENGKMLLCDACHEAFLKT